ncbi:FHA domain-containing protein [Saccharopolyspora sp. NPDC050642]|uniref:FHA domain-containing protein n=1 Tax=Saccharopolyspora sp. NPDC050642 TaxID=3157099 RepID=UPI0034087E35
MEPPTVIIDLSPVVRSDGKNDWRRVELVVKGWREQRDARAVFYGVADNSLWRKMDDRGKRGLQEWKCRESAHSVSWADPDILELAEKYPDAAVITTDLFRDHRRKHPWLQGSQRFYAPTFHADTVCFTQLDYSPIPDYQVSRYEEEANLKPKGITSSEARQALKSEWSCTNKRCVVWGSAAVIDADPGYRDGKVRCPECGEAAERAGIRERTREIVVVLDEHITDRIPVAEGAALTIGRGRGSDRYDVRDLLDEKHVNLVSRDHVRLSNEAGRLSAEDLGSKNGTMIIRSSGDTSKLIPEVRQTLQVDEQLSLARGAMRIRLSGRKRARGRYAPDLTIAPWLAKNANGSGH